MISMRGGSLRARLTRTLVGLGLLSVVLLATVNFFVVRGLLDRGVHGQLASVRDMREASIELSIDRLLTRVAVLGGDKGIADALDAFSAAYGEIDMELTDDQLDELAAPYEPTVELYDAAGVEHPPATELVPTTTPGRYVQYHYVADNPYADDERAELADAGDGSAYSDVHVANHEFLRGLAGSVGASDLLLVDGATAEVVYSVDKHLDLGQDVETGALTDSGLGTSWHELGGTAVNDAVLSDSRYYLPSSNSPVVHVAAAVRSRAEVIGAVVVTFEIDALTTMVSADGQWDDLGLGNTGDAYVVGADFALRTMPRSWSDDPEGYIDRYLDTGGDERAADLMEFTESPVLIQTVDNPAVRAARAGERFIGTVDSYFGRETLAASAPVDAGDLGWIVVTEQETGETRDELERFAVTIGLLLAVLLPVLAIIGVVLARALARPVRPLVDAAGRIADGDYLTDVPDLGRTELGDVGRQLEGVAAELRQQEEAIEEEEARITTMLSSVLPESLVDPVRRGERSIGDVTDTGTVVTITVRGLPEPSGSEQEMLHELSTRLTHEITGMAEARRIERVRVAPEQLLFVAGRGQPGHDAAAAAALASDVVDMLERVATELGLEFTAHAGLAAGLVATGLLGSRQVALGMWGGCVERSIDLSRLAGPGEVLADESVVDELDESWDAVDAATDHGFGVPDDATFALQAAAHAVDPS